MLALAGTIVMWPKHLPVLFKKTMIKFLGSVQSEAQVWTHIILVTPLSLKGRNIWLKARGQLQHEYGWHNNMYLCLSPISTQHFHLEHITSKLFFPPPPPHTYAHITKTVHIYKYTYRIIKKRDILWKRKPLLDAWLYHIHFFWTDDI